MKKIKVALFSIEDPFDRKPQSGTLFKVRESFEKEGMEVVWLQAHKYWYYKLLLYIVKAINKVFNTKLPTFHTRFDTYLYSRTVDKKLMESCDIIFCPFTQPDPTFLTKPYVFMSDGTIPLMYGYYWPKANYYKWAINEAYRVQEKNVRNASHIVMSSDWSRNSIISDYGISPEKVTKIEYGANIDDKDIISKEYAYDGHLHILFLAVRWERKGGDIAVAATKWLNENGINTTLHIVGIRNLSEDVKAMPFIDYAGFLNKNNTDDYQKLVSIIKQCHCLLLPSLAECSAISFCESSAYGIPVFSHITGGVPSYIYDGRNGYLLPLGSSGADFGKKIRECLLKGELEYMSKEAPKVYRERLNWDEYGKRCRKVFLNVLETL